MIFFFCFFVFFILHVFFFQPTLTGTDEEKAEIEATLNRELPEIGKRCGLIVGELRYCGIGSFGGNNYRGPTATLLIMAQCNERDLYEVNLFVNREVLLLLKREGINVS